MKKILLCILLFVFLIPIFSACKEEGAAITGSVYYYTRPTLQFTAPESVTEVPLSKKQAKEIRKIIDNVDEWVDDHTVDRDEYYFNGEIHLFGEEFPYYFSDKNHVLYYDHYIGTVTEEEIEYILNINR